MTTQHYHITNDDIKALCQDDIADMLIHYSCRHILFDGWKKEALSKAAEELSLSSADAHIMISEGSQEMIARYSYLADRTMQYAFEKSDTDNLGTTAKIKLLVMIRLHQQAYFRDAIRQAIAILAMPQNILLSKKLLYDTCHMIWSCAGDISTDSNHYSKRLLLAAVYSSTVLAWLNDDSDDLLHTSSFLDNRLRDVHQLPKKLNINNAITLFNKSSIFSPIRRTKAIKKFFTPHSIYDNRYRL